MWPHARNQLFSLLTSKSVIIPTEAQQYFLDNNFLGNHFTASWAELFAAAFGGSGPIAVS
jgi:hypothetical protein